MWTPHCAGSLKHKQTSLRPRAPDAASAQKDETVTQRSAQLRARQIELGVLFRRVRCCPDGEQ